jgi:hypothetical protein
MNRRIFLEAATALVLGSKIPVAVKEPEVRRHENGYLIAKIAKADTPNGNKRVYPKAILEDIANKHVKTTLGELTFGYSVGYSGENSVVHLSEVSHEIIDLSVNNGYLEAVIKVLDTPKGKELKNINLNRLAFRLRGFGNFEVNDNQIATVTDYKLVTIDAMPIDIASTF